MRFIWFVIIRVAAGWLGQLASGVIQAGKPIHVSINWLNFMAFQSHQSVRATIRIVILTHTYVCRFVCFGKSLLLVLFVLLSGLRCTNKMVFAYRCIFNNIFSTQNSFVYNCFYYFYYKKKLKVQSIAHFRSKRVIRELFMRRRFW